MAANSKKRAFEDECIINNDEPKEKKRRISLSCNVNEIIYSKNEDKYIHKETVLLFFVT